MHPTPASGSPPLDWQPEHYIVGPLFKALERRPAFSGLAVPSRPYICLLASSLVPLPELSLSPHHRALNVLFPQPERPLARGIYCLGIDPSLNPGPLKGHYVSRARVTSLSHPLSLLSFSTLDIPCVFLFLAFFLQENASSLRTRDLPFLYPCCDRPV